MFPKISSANPRSARAIREVNLVSLERSWGVFMRGIRALGENLSENLAKNFRGSDAFSANGAASQVSLGHRPRDSIVAELTSAEGANQLRFKGQPRLEQTNQQLNRAFSAGGFSFAIPTWGVAPGSF